MKKGVETAAATKAVAAAAAAAAAASLAENVDLWAQQDWIKTILSKSGTEMKEVPAEGNWFGFGAKRICNSQLQELSENVCKSK